MLCIPIYLAILKGRRISDVIRPFETKAQAIAQCHAWTYKTVDLHEEHVPGYVYWAQYGGEADTIRVEHHTLELDDSDLDDSDSEADEPQTLTTDEHRFLSSLTPEERAGLSVNGFQQPGQEDA